MALKTCLGLFSLRGGVIFVALLSAVASTLVFQKCVGDIVMLSEVPLIWHSRIDGTIWYVLISGTIYSAIDLFSSVSALFGVYKARSEWLIPFMILLFVSSILSFAIFLWVWFEYGFILMIFFYTMDALVANLYFFLVVISYKNSPSFGSRFGSTSLEMDNVNQQHADDIV